MFYPTERGVARGTVDAIHVSVCLQWAKGKVGVGGFGLAEEFRY